MFLKRINRIALLLFAVGLLLMIYGTIAENAKIYFFWEAFFYGYIIMLVGLIWSLVSLRRYQKANGRKPIVSVIGLVLASFVLVLLVAGRIVVSQLDAYKAAEHFFRTNDSMRVKLGGIRDIFPFGSASSQSRNDTTLCDMRILVKGERKYLDATVYLYKPGDTAWRVVEIDHE